MPISFRGVIKRRTSDSDKASTITFDVPASDYDEVCAAAKKEGVLYITILDQGEVSLMTAPAGD